MGMTMTVKIECDSCSELWILKQHIPPFSLQNAIEDAIKDGWKVVGCNKFVCQECDAKKAEEADNAPA